MKLIEEILKRKIKGIDCTEDESAELKQYFKNTNPSDYTEICFQLMNLFIAEWSESAEEAGWSEEECSQRYFEAGIKFSAAMIAKKKANEKLSDYESKLVMDFSFELGKKFDHDNVTTAEQEMFYQLELMFPLIEEPIRRPLKLEQLKALRDERGFIKVKIKLTMDDMLEGLDTLNDIANIMIVSDDYVAGLEDLSYNPVGIVKSGKDDEPNFILVEVTANANAEIEQLEYAAEPEDEEEEN